MAQVQATATFQGRNGGEEARQLLLATLPVTERRVDLAGIATAVLEGGSGSPVVLLHGPMANATHWMRADSTGSSVGFETLPPSSKRLAAPSNPKRSTMTTSGSAAMEPNASDTSTRTDSAAPTSELMNGTDAYTSPIGTIAPT